MKTIGMIGGMSWESSLEYYRIINEAVKQSLGGLHSAECILHSLDFARIEQLQHGGDWKALEEILVDSARKLQAAGAGIILICTNTMHLLADAVESAVSARLLHIADAAGEAIAARGMRRIGLLGTQFTMQRGYYSNRLSDRYGVEVIVPVPEDQEVVHRTIYEELCLGVMKGRSREAMNRIIRRLGERGVEGVILGCTELPLLVREAESGIPLFDTTDLHARAAAAIALSG